MATFTKKGKRWLFKHYIGTNKETGKRQSVLRRGFSTLKRIVIIPISKIYQSTRKICQKLVFMAK
ncbi:Arm DNA-binding domain-containing protein [Brochothrix thermosphacta]|uniref:Arm DNA-binding domain-containing protein n=1 Tax=Brochothrix thermosphacta TaxID=2756 RepID=UPI0039AE9DA5